LTEKSVNLKSKKSVAKSKWPQDLDINEVNTEAWVAEKDARTNGRG